MKSLPAPSRDGNYYLDVRVAGKWDGIIVVDRPNKAQVVRTRPSLSSLSSESPMPRVFRVMRKDPDDLPTVGPTSLGVRPGIDVDLDAQNNVLVNGKGMSVAPNWRHISRNRIPKRLRGIVPGARGSNNTFCFGMGDGAFVQGDFANGLTLEPDSATHGNVAPAQVVPLAAYEADIAATRPDWKEDES